MLQSMSRTLPKKIESLRWGIVNHEPNGKINFGEEPRLYWMQNLGQYCIQYGRKGRSGVNDGKPLEPDHFVSGETARVCTFFVEQEKLWAFHQEYLGNIPKIFLVSQGRRRRLMWSSKSERIATRIFQEDTLGVILSQFCGEGQTQTTLLLFGGGSIKMRLCLMHRQGDGKGHPFPIRVIRNSDVTTVMLFD